MQYLIGVYHYTKPLAFNFNLVAYWETRALLRLERTMNLIQVRGGGRRDGGRGGRGGRGRGGREGREGTEGREG